MKNSVERSFEKQDEEVDEIIMKVLEYV